MWKKASEETHSNKIGLSIIGEASDGLTLGLPPATHLKMFGQKRNTHKLLRSNHPYYRNMAKHLWREPQIISIFGSTSATSVNAYFLQCRVSSHASVCILQTAIYNLNFIVLLLISRRISQNWFPTASGVLLLGSRIIF